jgi:hypothetical protein
METLGYLSILIGIPLMPVAMIVGHEFGEQSRRRKASENARKSVQES